MFTVRSVWGIDLQRVHELNAVPNSDISSTPKTIVHHRVAQQELSRPIEQAVDGGKLFEIVLHSLTAIAWRSFVLHHGILCVSSVFNLGQGVYLPDARFVRVENLTFADGDFQFRVESCEKACHHVLKTVEHGQGAYQRQHVMPPHTEMPEMILMALCFFLEKEVAAGYKKDIISAVHQFVPDSQ